MKYEAPKLTTLVPAIEAVQGTNPNSKDSHTIDSRQLDVATPAYADWEE
jgi:hypothetical protein